MKVFSAVISILFFGVNLCRAQDTVVTLSPQFVIQTVGTDRHRRHGRMGFQTGNDSTWKANNIKGEGWEKLRPDQLSAKYADKDGRVEGWFRIKIKLDSSFTSHLVGLKMISWAASDIYINGSYLISFGIRGIMVKPFKEIRSRSILPAVVDLIPGKQYIIALHIVDYMSPLSIGQLKSNESIYVQ